MPCLSLSLLGPFEVALDGAPVSGFVSNKARALLAYLAVESERPHRRDSLAARYPYVANSRWFEDVAGREIAAAAQSLPPEMVAAAQERGRARELWATVDELLAELASYT